MLVAWRRAYFAVDSMYQTKRNTCWHVLISAVKAHVNSEQQDSVKMCAIGNCNTIKSTLHVAKYYCVKYDSKFVVQVIY